MPLNDAYAPHGAAALRYFRGDRDAMLACEQDGRRDDVPAAFWFRTTLDPLESLALDRCTGRVLDLGAGVGVHALALQRRGLAVLALDISPDCVAIMRERGVQRAVAADLFGFEGGPFDTILCLCNGLDKVGRLADLPRFLARMRALLAEGGQIIADSFDLRVDPSAATRKAMRRRTAEGRYFGEADLVLAFEGRRGAPFTVLHVDPETLGAEAAGCGFGCEVIAHAGARYLARLVPAPGHAPARSAAGAA